MQKMSIVNPRINPISYTYCLIKIPIILIQWDCLSYSPVQKYCTDSSFFKVIDLFMFLQIVCASNHVFGGEQSNTKETIKNHKKVNKYLRWAIDKLLYQNICTVFSPAITAIKSIVVWVISIVKDCVLKYKNTLKIHVLNKTSNHVPHAKKKTRAILLKS